MKVYSLYHNDTYVASFPNKEDAIFYGKQFYEDGWSCNIIEEYLSKSPLLYSAPYTPPTPPNTISPNITKLVHTAQPNDPKPYFDTYGGVKAEPYRNVRAYWND
jgi:hypothetical protein